MAQHPRLPRPAEQHTECKPGTRSSQSFPRMYSFSYFACSIPRISSFVNWYVSSTCIRNANLIIIFFKVCADMARYIRNDVISQYHIELAINGMVDGPPGGPSMEERLRQLRDYVSRLRRGAEAIIKLRRSAGSNTKSFVRADCSVHWTYRQGNSEIEILSALALGASQVASRAVITVPHLVHVEAVDLSQGLLVVSDEFVLTGPG